MRLVAVSIDLAVPRQVRTAEALAAFAERRGIALPLLALSGDFDALTEEHDWPGGVPFSVLLGPRGELARLDGPGEPEEFRALVARARGR